MVQKELTTNRLILRPFEMRDAEAVLAFNGNAEVQRYTGDSLTQTLEEAYDLIEHTWWKDYTTYGYGRLAAVDKATDTVIGFAGLKYLPELDATDLGFRFLPAYWGKGLATEAAKRLLTHGFEDLGLTEIIAFAQVENIGSCRVLEKMGMEHYQTAGYMEGKEQYRWYRLSKGS